jgi:hypothetical protein
LQGKRPQIRGGGLRAANDLRAQGNPQNGKSGWQRPFHFRQ